MCVCVCALGNTAVNLHVQLLLEGIFIDCKTATMWLCEICI
jgi:hypothetical protein